MLITFAALTIASKMNMEHKNRIMKCLVLSISRGKDNNKSRCLTAGGFQNVDVVNSEKKIGWVDKISNEEVLVKV